MAKSKSAPTPLVEENGAQSETVTPSSNSNDSVVPPTPLVEENGADLQQPSSTISVDVSVALDTLNNVTTDSVDVLIKYPETWDKERFMKDNDIKTVSKETAKTFIEIGIATLVNE